MTKRHTVLESATGDELGVIALPVGASDEHVISALVLCGFLEEPADAYTIDDAFMFADEGQRVVVSVDRQHPVVTLETEEEAV